MRSYWFGDTGTGESGAGDCRPFRGDAEACADRVLSLVSEREPAALPDWRTAVACGAVGDRAEYLVRLHAACMVLCERRIAEQYRGRDVGLLQMVRTLDELDTVINQLTGRATDWYTAGHPEFSRKYRRVSSRTLLRTIARHSRGGLARMVADIGQLAETRSALAGEVSAVAGDVLPNCSALIGGLVAARLLFHAGGLVRLSRLPGSAIQVLGARTALFSHLAGGTPPPKHGIIFQHRRVHNAPQEVRGRVARVLAAKLAIAARIDLYRGTEDPEFLIRAQAAIDAAGVSH